MPSQAGFSRRTFLNTGITASAVLLSTRRARAADARADIRAAMIGTGGRGRGVLRAVVNSPGVKVTALCDINEKNLDQGAKIAERDKPKRFSDYRNMLEHPELDAVFIETPCHLHYEMVDAALRAGKHVYGEK